MRLTTKRLVIRDLKLSDAKSITKHVNNLKVCRFLTHVPHPYELTHANSFLREHVAQQKKKERKDFALGITLKGKDEVIGIVSLDGVHAFQGTAVLGYWLSQDYWRKGIMTEAARALIDFGFKKLNLRRINVDAYVENVASNALIRKLGFHHEGTARNLHRAQSTGKVHDTHTYGLLREEWK